MNEQDYSYLKRRITQLTGIEIDSYKSQQMSRRLEGFIAKQTPPEVIAYCQALEQSMAKRRELVDFLGINVSEFFRDASQFQVLKGLILPTLLKHSPRLKIWSAACSCGQEAYSIAILLAELSSGSEHRILATDIDEGALEKASNGGPYSPEDVKNVDKRLLHKYFVQTDKGYRIVDRLKNKIEFKRQNLLTPPFKKDFDLVVCRNVIIYFTDDVKEKLYQDLYHSLKVGGVLFLGGTELILRPSDLGLGMLCPSFYRKLPVGAKAVSPPMAVGV